MITDLLYFIKTYKLEILCTFMLSTLVYLTGLLIFKRSKSNTIEFVQKTYQSTVKLNKFNINHNNLSKNNAVYLTQFKKNPYMMHIIYAIMTYFKDPVNMFCLFISFGQIYEYKDYRSFVPLIIFASIHTINHIYSISSLITSQYSINNTKIKKIVDTKLKTVKLIKQQNLKRGDFVKLTDTDQIPADILLLNSQAIVQELNLTGEDIMIIKQGFTVDPEYLDVELTINHLANNGNINNYYYDSRNMIFRGTKIIDTYNKELFGVVIETGNDCQIFRINNEYKKHPTKIQQSLSQICLSNLYLLLIIASFFGIILYAKSDETKKIGKLWNYVRKMILLLNTMVPLSLQFFFNSASIILSKRIETDLDLQVNRNGITCFQHNPYFIVSDKTGTVTTNKMDLIDIQHNKPHDKFEVLLNILACTQIQPHSKTGELLKSDILEEQLLTKLLKDNDMKLKSNSSKIIIEHKDNTITIDRIFSHAFDYKLEVKIAVIKYNNKYYLHIQGTPEAINNYSDYKLAPLLENLDQKDYPQSAYRRVIAHAAKEIDAVDVTIVKHHPKEILNNFDIVSLYVFHDYLVSNIQKSISIIFQEKRDFTMLTGDRQVSAQEIGKTMGLYNFNNTFDINTEKDLDSIFDISTHETCVFINGRLLESLVNSNKEDKLKTIIALTNRRIIYRASPAAKQLYIMFLQRTFPNHETMMVGDGLNDMAAIIQANVGVSIRQENNTQVQNTSDIIISDWNTIPKLFNNFTNKRQLITNINNLVLIKHMITAFMLITMVLLSNFQKIRDPASPFLMSLLNGTIYLCMILYSKYEDVHEEHTLSSSYMSIFRGILLGILDGFLVFTFFDPNIGIKILLCIQVIQLIMILNKMSKNQITKLVYLLLIILWWIFMLASIDKYTIKLFILMLIYGSFNIWLSTL